MGRERITTWAEVQQLVLRQIEDGLTNQTEQNWDYEGAASNLGYNKSTLIKMVSQKKIPHHKVNGKVYFLKGEIVRWIKTDGESAAA